MNATAIVYPLLVQVALTFVIGALLLAKRIQATRSRQVKLRDVALDSSNWPHEIHKFSNSYRNQFELPVLFYLLGVLLMIGGQGGNGLNVMLAWAFVAMRIVHAFIHVTSNHVLRRFYAFFFSALILIALWVLFAFELII